MNAAELPAPQLGRILIAAGLLSEEQLAQALEEQEQTGRRLGEIIVQRGFISGPALANALAEQHGGVLKTEYGFASGLGGVVARRAASEAGNSFSPLRPPDPPPMPTLRAAEPQAVSFTPQEEQAPTASEEVTPPKEQEPLERLTPAEAPAPPERLTPAEPPAPLELPEPPEPPEPEETLDPPPLLRLRGDGARDAPRERPHAVARAAPRRRGRRPPALVQRRLTQQLTARFALGASASERRPWPAFSARERRIIEALVARALPPGPRFPATAQELRFVERLEAFFADMPEYTYRGFRAMTNIPEVPKSSSVMVANSGASAARAAAMRFRCRSHTE